MKRLWAAALLKPLQSPKMSRRFPRARPLVRQFFAWCLVLFSSHSAFAQNQEVAGSLSALLRVDRTSATRTPFSLDPDYALGLSYEHRFFKPGPVALFAGIDFVANQLRTVSSADRTLTRDVATIYLTPNVMAKLTIVPRITPWALLGGGVSLYEQSHVRIDGMPNPATRDVTHGAFVFGGGVDIPVWRSIALRAQVKDYYTGSPSYNTPLTGGQHNVLAGGALVFGWGR